MRGDPIEGNSISLGSLVRPAAELEREDAASGGEPTIVAARLIPGMLRPFYRPRSLAQRALSRGGPVVLVHGGNAAFCSRRPRKK